jgi:hypothetical protein
MKFKSLIALGLIVLLVASCKKSKPEDPADIGYDYYPGKVGSYVVYDVDSISYTQLPAIDTLYYKFQIKESIDTLFYDQQNRPTLKIIRYRKNYDPNVPYSQLSWVLQDVWTANLNSTSVQVVEENVRYTKLIFPVRKSATWNGNAHNTIGEWEYKYSEVDQAATVGGIAFSKTLKVTQKNFISAINKQVYLERYAKGAGLIYKLIEDYDYQDGSGNANPGHIYGGTYFEMRVNSYGNE